jgi:hypothetical protein
MMHCFHLDLVDLYLYVDLDVDFHMDLVLDLVEPVEEDLVLVEINFYKMLY